MEKSLYIYSILYILTTLFSSLGIKTDQYYYEYDNFWIIIFFNYLLFPLNLILYSHLYSFKSLSNIFNLYIMKETFIPSFIYTIETILLLWALNNIPVSVYIIGRTSSSYFSVIFTKYYLKKEVGKLYYIGLIVLFISYILLFINYNNFEKTIETKIAVVIVILSGLTSSLNNCLIEKKLNSYEDKINMQWGYQIYGNLYGFITIFLVSIFFCIKDKIIYNIFVPNLIFIFVGISFQTYFFFKNSILGTTTYTGNQIVSGLDIIRRVLTNIIAYFLLSEYYNTEILIATLCMLIGSIFILISQKKKLYEKINNSSNIILTDMYIIDDNKDGDEEISSV